MALMRDKQQGIGIITDPSVCGGQMEVTSIQCGHCGNTLWEDDVPNPVIMRGNVRDTSGRDALCARCTCCSKTICLNCVGKGCTPLEKRLEAWENRKSYELGET